MNNNQKKRLLIIGALLVLLGVSTYELGYKVLLVALVAVISAVILEIIATKVRKEKFDFTSYFITPLVFALIISLNVYDHIWMVALCVIFGVFFAKSLFGGQDKNLFNPAALGLVFALLSFPAYLLNTGTGNAMGEVFVYTALGLAVLLMALKAISPYTLISYLVVLVGIYGLFYLLNNNNQSITDILFKTNMVFVGIFMITEPTTSPKSPLGQIIYGLSFGLLVWLINTQSSNAEFAAVYVVLLANAISPLIDQSLNYFKDKKEITDNVDINEVNVWKTS